MQKTVLIIAFIVNLFFLAHPLSNVFAQDAPSVCQFAGDKQSACESCMNAGKGAWTAFGCIKTDPASFVAEVLRVGIGVGGGIAFLLILFGGFQILTSAGNPEQLTAGRELV